MKTSTFFYSILSVLFLSSYLYAQQDSPVLNLVTTLNTNGANQLIFEPSGELEVNFWNHEYLQLNIRIDSTELRREQIKALVPLGFFRPEVIMEGKCLVLKMPGIERSTLFNGKEISWKIHYSVMLPNSIHIIRKVNEFAGQ